MTQQPKASKHLLRELALDDWSPPLYGCVLGISSQELASALGVSEEILHLRPGDTFVQRKLGIFADVLERLLDLRPNVASAAFHMKNTPIRELDHRRVSEAISEGGHVKALRYLQRICAGQNG